MSLILYELGGIGGRRYSLFSWRAKLAIAHKGLKAESVPVRVSDKSAIAFSGQDKVPILRDGDQTISDSWRIAEHLEQKYPERPSLVGAEIGHGLTRVINAWVDRALVPKLVPLLMTDVLGIVDEDDGAHLRRGMEAAFKRKLEELAATRETEIVSFRRLLDPARAALRTQPFLCGASPAYADYILFSLLQWARVVSPLEVLDANDALAAWREKLLDLHGGLARAQAPRGKEAA
jgi:glutathione S-transferase